MKEQVVIEKLDVIDAEHVTRAVASCIRMLPVCLDRLARAKRVLIKPNLNSDSRESTTNPLVTLAVVRLLEQAGVPEIVVADASVVGFDTALAFRRTGTEELLKGTSATLLDLKKGRYVRTPVPDYRAIAAIAVSQEVIDADFIINIPRMKTVPVLHISGALKNMKGVISDADKRRFHRTNLAAAIVDLYAVVKPDLTIVDGTYVHEMMMRSIPMNTILAGNTSVAADAVTARVLSIDPFDITHLCLAAEQEGSSIAEAEIEVIGNEIAQVRRPVRIPPSKLDELVALYFTDWQKMDNIRIMERNACSGCTIQLLNALKRYVESGRCSRDTKLTIVMGESEGQIPIDEECHYLFLGNCARRSYESCQGHVLQAEYVRGCMPFSRDILAALESVV